MKIAFFEVEPWEKEYLAKKFIKQKILFFDDELNESNIDEVKDFDIISIFIESKINKKIINKFEKLKAIVTRSTGYDHIDIKYCKKKNILVLNTPYYGENTVAEQTFALILALSRKIVDAVERTERRDFSLEGLKGFDLKDKTLGIVGTGSIGSYVARIAKGFEMNILANSQSKKPELVKKFGVRYTTLEDLFKKSDIITFHVPLTKETRHLISKKSIKLIKKGAYLINTSRGEIVETNALISALNKKILAGAGLDVLEDEGFIKEEKQLLSKKFSREKLFNMIENNILLNYKNVIITPHNAFNTQEALNRILNTTAENIKSVIKGKVKNQIK